MMRCPKCQGCVVFDGEERRCVNCGNRPDLIVRVIEPEPEGVEIGRLRCRIYR
jgi:hypothetical protein